MRFFLTGVLDTSTQAVETAKKILALFEEHRKTIATMGRASLSTLRVQELLQKKPITSISDAAKLRRSREVVHLCSAEVVHPRAVEQAS